jgi:hypothetical protein
MIVMLSFEIPYLIIMPATLYFCKVILFLLGLVASSGSSSLSACVLSIPSLDITYRGFE